MDDHKYARRRPKNKRERHNCCVPQCSEVKTESNHLHTVPADHVRRKTWAVAIKTGKPLHSRMAVCSKHYLPEDYIRSGKLLRPNLKKTAVPSQNLPVRSLDKCLTSPEKRKKHARANRAIKRALLTEINANQNREIPNETSSGESSSEQSSSEQSSTDDDTEEEEFEDVPELSASDTTILKDAGIQVDLDSETSYFVRSILSNDTKLFTATGLHSQKLLSTLACCLDGVAPKGLTKDFSMCSRDRILLAMTKVKLGISFSSLAVFFDVTIQTACNYFYDTVTNMAEVLKCIVFWPDKEQILKNMPKCFADYKSTRAVLDCFEVPVEKPKCVKCRVRLYSNYKKGYTIKILLICAPSGLITKISKPFGGRVSDKFITEHSGVYQLCEPQDSLMVDKGFAIEDECLERNINLIRPPFLRKNRKFSRAESVQCAKIARARVHVERAIQRIREYSIIKNKVPWNLTPYYENITLIVCALVNLGKPILAMDKF